ncbi:fatty acid elongase [Toxoplasma gondii TgCatPRC2]|uniref:Elongation of fatty acids protein n=13 Tax=Toxoplasma gondii TaxID=5811 RepID=S7W0L5_TOXGG|nr:fatty acid elongase [Toxoplasma gondii GT1]KAF4643302.1 fatty acid elongase [Toxoplasma gondii]KFG28981.1 fatty acid elongase [Toxoplasma gondii p89]KFG32821.1 fatty acid elongase [Toxoplasma gondii GAB2-2007-GAL-DOM2]KFG51175.1 fatty acid elongase [Toxoplasma gondii FOU]KFH04956.1 fatty acid elongase [Toxoplasma gondii VAND]KFH06895.1 fatty acid elongase [Toxoplasma gondii MAS]KYF41143.1 fatty acid elongase [Toxoplasma gondii ARI]KYK72212.1 fatty acid elongase [Toxoplasma gondii TgCatPR
MAPTIVDAPLIQLLADGYGQYRQFLLSQPHVGPFLEASDRALLSILDFYNPTLPQYQRVSARWPFMQPMDLVIFTLTYLTFVAGAAGIRFLSSRKQQSASSGSYEVDKPVKRGDVGPSRPSLAEKMSFILLLQIVYNIFQVVTCSYVVYKAMSVYVAEGYTIVFNKFDPSRRNMAEIVWLFYLTKVVDLLDTVFIVCRGKWAQFSFLHIYHHASILYMMWVNASVGYDGDIYFAVAANGAIHVVMYAYYLMASLNIGAARYIKPFITRMQMTQFLGMLGQGFYHICFYQDCQYPIRIGVVYLGYIVSMYVLFDRFAKRTYGTKNAGKGNACQKPVRAAGTSPRGGARKAD